MASLIAGCSSPRDQDKTATCEVVAERYCLIVTEVDRLASLKRTEGAAGILAALAPGEERETTGAFRRDVPRWPYLDTYVPGRQRSPDQPDTPHAAYFLGASEDGTFGPIVMIAPATVGHALSGDGDDTWRVLEGPRAPTLYGDARTPAGTVHFIAHPVSPDPAIHDETARRALYDALETYFRAGASAGSQ